MQLNRVNVPNEGATGVDLTNAANGDIAVVQGRAGIGLVRTHDIKVWRGRELGDKALQRIAPPPGKLLAQPIKGGWLGRVRHMLQERAERVQEQSAQRQAALGLEQSPAVQVGPKWLTSLGSFRSRLQSIVAALKERVASVPSATAQATAQSVPSGPVLQTVKAAAAQVAATVQSAGGKEIKEGVVYSTIKTAAPDSTTNADAAALAQVTAAVQQRFAAQAGNKESFTELLKQAFGDKFDAAKAEAIRQQALAGDFSWAPKIQVVSSQALADLSGTQAAGSAKGAYVQDTDTIYISRELLQNDSQEAQRILMEEIGHGIDARINTSDAVGDEGEIFAKLMHGEHISAPELAALKADNDHGVVNINGRNVTVEYGWLKKAFKAITGGIKKVVSAVVKGAVDLAKSAVKVTVGLATFNFDKVKEGFKEGVNAVKSTVKTVVKAVKDTAKELHKIVKEAFVKLMQSKIFAIVLTICRFIPIPVVQLVVRVVDVVRSAYMVYQGIKNKSLSMVLGGVASLASGGAKLAGSLGASASTISTIKTVADAASKLSMAYNAVANKDIGAALSLLGGAVGGPNSNPTLNNLVTVGGYAQQAIGIGQAIKNKDVLGALSGGLGLAGTVVGSDSPESRNISQNLADAKEVVTGLQVVREIDRGNLDGAHALASNMNSAQQASQKADATLAQQRADEEAAAQAAKNRSLLNQADKDLRAQAAEQEGEPQEAKESQASPQETAAADEHRNGSDIDSDNMAERNGGVGPGSSQSLLTVSKGQTLEAIARAQYGENWRAGLTQIMLDNNIKLNQWGSPILSVGKTLVLNDLSGKSEAELASLARTGGRIISNNDKGLAAKAELEERARVAKDVERIQNLTRYTQADREADPNYRMVVDAQQRQTTPTPSNTTASTPSGYSLTKGYDQFLDSYQQFKSTNRQNVEDLGVSGGGGVQTGVAATIYAAGEIGYSLLDAGFGLGRLGAQTFDSWNNGTLVQDAKLHVIDPTVNFAKTVNEMDTFRLSVGAKLTKDGKPTGEDVKFMVGTDRIGFQYKTKGDNADSVARTTYEWASDSVKTENLIERNFSTPLQIKRDVAGVPLTLEVVPGLRYNLTGSKTVTPSINLDLNVGKTPQIPFGLKVSVEARKRGG
jgi:hypothetical protein